MQGSDLDEHVIAALQVMRAVDTATGLVLLAAGLMSVRRAPGWLLLAAGLAWFAGDAASWAVYLHRGPLVQLVVVYPFLRPRGAWAWVLTVAGYACATLPVLTASSPAAFVLAAALVLSAGYSFAVATGPGRRARRSRWRSPCQPARPCSWPGWGTGVSRSRTIC